MERKWKIINWLFFALIVFSIVIGICRLLAPFVAAKKEADRVNALPNPVILENGMYWVPLYDRHLFAVPEGILNNYSRNSTDGTVGNIAVHAYLPDFAPYDPKKESKYSFVRNDDYVSVTLYPIRWSANDIHKSWFYTMQGNMEWNAEKGIRNKLISENPHIESHPYLSFENTFLIEGETVPQYMSCNNLPKTPHPHCDVYKVYADNYYAEIYFHRKYEKDWLQISDQAIRFLKSFERPLNEYPEKMPE